MANLTRFYVTIIVFLLCFQISAQFTVGNLNLDGDIDKWYNQAIGYENLGFLEGAYYRIESQTIQQHQFFRSMSWLNGTIAIDGRLFKDVKILYNTYKDVLLALNIGMEVHGVQSIKLNHYRIDSFLIEDAKFINLRGKNLPSAGSGFYQKYYDGVNISFYIKRIKIKSSDVETVVYNNNDTKYVLYQDQYFRFNGKKSLYTMFPDKKKRIKKYIKQSPARINKKTDDGLYELMSYCDQLLLQ